LGTSQQHAADGAQQFAHVGLDHRAAAVEHGPVEFVDDLDAQAVTGEVELDLRGELRQLGVVLELALHLLAQFLQLGGLGHALLMAFSACRLMVLRWPRHRRA
jgi:hypothetical protein